MSRDQPARGFATTAWPILLIVLLGAALRVSQLEQSLYGDELWSWVGATSPSFGGMLDWVRSDEEITPPLYTALAWLSVKLGEPTTLIRLPSLLAGIATIPMIYAIALRTLGRRVAITAAMLAALSPFLAFYAVEARAYGLAVGLVAASSLSMLLALDRDRWTLWWVAYAGFSCTAMLTHYTSVYVLAFQFAWILWLRPEARRPALLANAAAAAVFLLWLPGLAEDLTSPSQVNIGTLAPLNLHNASVFTGSFALGHPARDIHSLYGTWVEAALLVGLAVAIAGLGFVLARRRGWLRRAGGEAIGGDVDDVAGRREWIIMFVGMAVAAPVGIALVSLVGTDMYLPRNLATSAPALLIAGAALLNGGPPRPRAVALTLVIGAFAYGAYQTTQPHWQRPSIREAAELVEANATADDVVLDVVWFGGEPLPDGRVPPLALTLDVNFESLEAVDALTVPRSRAAFARAAGHRLWIVGNPGLVPLAREFLGLDDSQPVFSRSYDGLLATEIEAFAVPLPAGAGGR